MDHKDLPRRDSLAATREGVRGASQGHDEVERAFEAHRQTTLGSAAFFLTDAHDALERAARRDEDHAFIIRQTNSPSDAELLERGARAAIDELAEQNYEASTDGVQEDKAWNPGSVPEVESRRFRVALKILLPKPSAQLQG